MQGRKIFNEDDSWRADDEPHPGDYWYSEANKGWFCRVLNGDFANLRKHEVTEHEDGTITVSPSILTFDENGPRWHGFLEHGVWREV